MQPAVNEIFRVHAIWWSRSKNSRFDNTSASWKKIGRGGGQCYTFSHAELAASVIPGFENRLSDVEGGEEGGVVYVR